MPKSWGVMVAILGGEVKVKGRGVSDALGDFTQCRITFLNNPLEHCVELNT